MITAPVWAHGVGKLAEPCWTIEPVTAPALGDELETGHWQDQADAEEALPGYATERRPASSLRVVQEDFRCTTLILLCGDTYVYQGDEDQSHFADEAHLFSSIPVGEVVQVGPDLFAEKYHCEKCIDAIREHEQSPADPAVPGQQSLLDGDER